MGTLCINDRGPPANISTAHVFHRFQEHFRSLGLTPSAGSLAERCHHLPSEEGILGFVTDGNHFDEEGSVPQQDDDPTLALLVASGFQETTREASHSSSSFLSVSRTASRGLLYSVKAVSVVTVLFNGTGPVHRDAWWTQ